jgi:hypothetical protein
VADVAVYKERVWLQSVNSAYRTPERTAYHAFENSPYRINERTAYQGIEKSAYPS